MHGGPSIILASEGKNTGSQNKLAHKTNHNNKILLKKKKQPCLSKHTGRVIQDDFHINLRTLHMHLHMQTCIHKHMHTVYIYIEVEEYSTLVIRDAQSKLS